MGWLNNWLINVVGEDKAKWLKGVLAWFLLTLIANLMLPLNIMIMNSGLSDVWISYILIALDSGSLVLGAIIVVFIGKPIQPQISDPVPAPVPDDTTPEPEPTPEPTVTTPTVPSTP